MQSLKRVLVAVLNAIFTPLIALLLIFEEWGWDPLLRLFALLGRLPLWAWVERWISRLPPYGALFLFLVPVLGLVPVKLLAVYWISEGDALLGLVLAIAAKLVGTALVAWLFHLTQPALMRLAWFARFYGRWKAWKDALIIRVRTTALWHAGQAIAAAARAAGRRGVAALRAWMH